MSALTHFNNFNTFDNLFDLFFNDRKEVSNGSKTLSPSLNAHESDKSITLTLELPGFSKEDIEISLESNELIISAQHKAEKEEKEESGKWLRKEISTGRYVRKLTLPDNIKAEKISAETKNGILTVVLPKVAREENIKKIAIK